MNYSELYAAIRIVNHSKIERIKMAKIILSNSSNISTVLEIAFQVNDPVSCKACWLLETIVKERLSILLPCMDYFVSNLNKVHFDSSVRPMAKVSEYLMKSYFQSKNEETQKVLNKKHLEHITTACFDWLIGKHKVAAQAYAMTCLLLLGREFNWIHPELQLILEQNYQYGSPAYKARARITLAKLK